MFLCACGTYPDSSLNFLSGSETCAQRCRILWICWTSPGSTWSSHCWLLWVLGLQVYVTTSVLHILFFLWLLKRICLHLMNLLYVFKTSTHRHSQYTWVRRLNLFSCYNDKLGVRDYRMFRKLYFPQNIPWSTTLMIEAALLLFLLLLLA